ncbi:MAG: MBL fold metallo-hydrolase [Acidobacteriota bacterium]|nr:MBL fold metallo-hydrolase [Acidobacteriota bacterium]
MFLTRTILFALFLLLPFTIFAQEKRFEITKLAAGVYAVIRKDSPGLGSNANNVFIINDKDVVVIDTNISPSYTREVLVELRKLTKKPVRYVINTHWHDDHINGNQVYRQAFPDVEFIGHADIQDYMTEKGLENRRQTLNGLPGFITYLRGLLQKGKSSGGRVLSSEEMQGLANDVGLAERFLKESPALQTILPSITVTQGLTLKRGNRVLEILHLGRGHTSGDLIVHLPQEKIVVTGDLVVYPVPYVGSDQSYIGDWSATLDKIIALKPAAIVPGHGPVLRDDSYLKLISRMFASVEQQTEAAIARGENLEQAQKSVNIEEFQQQITGESFYRKTIFRSYVAPTSVAAVFREATTKR